jgi:hypothetical protein
MRPGKTMIFAYGFDSKIAKLEVIATSNAHTSKKILDEYRITPGAIETIRDANGTLQ